MSRGRDRWPLATNSHGSRLYGSSSGGTIEGDSPSSSPPGAHRRGRRPVAGGRDGRRRDARRTPSASRTRRPSTSSRSWSPRSCPGRVGAIVAAIGAFLLYNFFFTEPAHTFTIADPGVLLSVLLLLFVGIVVGQLAALQRSRAEDRARPRARGPRPVQLSRALATRESTPRQCCRRSRRSCAPRRACTASGSPSVPTTRSERVAADTATSDPRLPGAPCGCSAGSRATSRPSGFGMHQPAPRARARSTGSRPTGCGSRPAARRLGSIWALRSRVVGEPGPDRDAAAGGRGRPDRPGPRPGPGGRGGAGGRDRPPERRAEVGAAPVRVARPPDAAGHDPRGRRHAAAWVSASRGRPARERRRHRARGRVPQPPRRPTCST